MIGKYQKLTILGAILLGVIMFFGFSLKKPDLKEIESRRLLNRVENSEPVLVSKAEKKLNADQADLIHVIKKAVDRSADDSEKVKNLKDLSGKWFDFGYPVISTIYAKQIAKIEETAEAWAIAGSTSYIALRRTEDNAGRNYAGESAIQCYENAVSLAPDDISYKVNLALTYVEYPPADEPMKGVLMLLDQEKDFPDEPLILKSLAQLSIKTGQYDKAAQRLERIIEQNPHDQKSWCLLAETYRHLSVSADQIEKANENCRN